MGPSEQIDEWARLKNVIWDWIEKQPMGVDENLALWLDPTEAILRNYKVLMLNNKIRRNNCQPAILISHITLLFFFYCFSAAQNDISWNQRTI